MKQLPDQQTLLELLEMAELKAKELCNLTEEIAEKWRIKLENRRISTLVQNILKVGK